MKTVGLPMNPSGYLHPGYATALAEFGEPTRLPRSGAWFLKRAISGTDAFDGMGCYPYLTCPDWSALKADLDELAAELVSFAAAPDPFGQFTVEDLHRAFPDHCVYFKDHYVADLSVPPEQIISKHHQTYAQKSSKQMDVEFCEQPVRYLEEWVVLFDELVRRFNITGIRAFSRESFAKQFAVPGVVMSLARHKGDIVAAHVQMVHGETAFGHLVAAKSGSHKLGGAYALYHAEIRYYAGKVRWIDWGGEAGVATGRKTLGPFKQGWSNTTRPAYFCGRIFNQERYEQLTKSRGVTPGKYFPAYRRGEFA